MNTFVELSNNEIQEVNGGAFGVVITGTRVISGVGLFAVGFTVGYRIGYMIKSWE